MRLSHLLLLDSLFYLLSHSIFATILVGEYRVLNFIKFFEIRIYLRIFSITWLLFRKIRWCHIWKFLNRILKTGERFSASRICNINKLCSSLCRNNISISAENEGTFSLSRCGSGLGAIQYWYDEKLLVGGIVVNGLSARTVMYNGVYAKERIEFILLNRISEINKISWSGLRICFDSIWAISACNWHHVWASGNLPIKDAPCIKKWLLFAWVKVMACIILSIVKVVVNSSISRWHIPRVPLNNERWHVFKAHSDALRRDLRRCLFL